MELFIVLLLLGLGYGVRGASDRVRGDLRKSREAKVKAAAKAAGGKLPKHQRAAVARRHTRGWWAREVSAGFPAARTGWHAGWIAHKTALARQQIIREEARTEHAETQTSFRKELAEHQKRQAAARAELERELAAQQAKGSPATGKSAVQKAADEVSRKREEKAARERKTPSLPATGTETAVPPLPADSVGKPAGASGDPDDYERVPCPDCGAPIGQRCAPDCHYDPRRPHAARPEPSAHLRPGEPRCEGCDGSGRNAAGTDACPACRGFGSAPADPMSPLAGPDAVCGACGHKERPGDPVLAAAGGYNVHLSHAREQQERYWDALNRMRQAGREPGPDAARWTPDDDRHAAIDDAVVAADHGYEGEFELAPSPTTTEGAPVPDTNYTAVLNNAKLAAEQADQDTVTASARRVVAQQHAEEMQAAEVDGATLGSQMDLVERLQVAEQAAKETGERAMAVYTGLQQRHGGLKQAHDDAPVRAAQRGFYEGD